MIPTMVCGTPFTITLRPSTRGSPPKRRFQRPSPMTTTASRPCWSSSAVNVRPRRGLAASKLKRLAETRAAGTRSGSPRPARLKRNIHEQGGLLQRARVVPEAFKQRRGDGPVERYGDQTARIAIRQRPQQGTVYDAEDGGGGGDAYGQREHCGGGESGARAHGAKGVLRVLHQGLQLGQAALIPIALFGAFHSAEFQQGLAAGFFRRQAVGEVVLGLHLQVGLHLGGEFAFAAGARERAGNALPGAAQDSHDVSPRSARKRPMISVVCRHWCVSDASSLRPALVRR